MINIKNSFPVLSSVHTLLVLFIFTLSHSVPAQETSQGLPEMVIPQGVGVNTHFLTGGAKDHDMIAQAGIKFIRQDLCWNEVETVKGEYNWAPFDTLIRELDERNIRGLITLNRNNPLYCEKGTRWGPKDPDNIAAFARFASEVAGRYKGHNIVWEIWNEPNGKHTFLPYINNAYDYAALALTACKAMRKADPSSIIIAPAMAGIHPGWLDTLFKAGLLKYINGVCVHPYRDGPLPKLPETVGPQIKEIQALIAKYAPAGKYIPVISGEWGYSTCLCDKGVSLQTQADYIARMQLFNLSLGVPLTIWYDWKNDGYDVTQKGQFRGLVTHDLELKPSYVAMSTLISQLSGYRVIERFDSGDTLDVILVLKNSNGETKLAAWTQGKAHGVNLPSTLFSKTGSEKKLWWIDGNAKSDSVSINEGNLSIELRSTPKYISTRLPEPMPEFGNITLPANIKAR